MANLNADNKRRLYMNTLVFCLISGVVSLGLLALLMYGGGAAAAFLPFVTTLTLGLLVVVIVALATIIKNERLDRLRAENATQNLVAVKKCPDYWTIASDPTDRDKNVCIRRYVTPPTTDGPESTTSVFIVGAGDEKQESTIELGNLDNKQLQDVCKTVRSHKTPWTDIAPICSAYRI